MYILTAGTKNPPAVRTPSPPPPKSRSTQAIRTKKFHTLSLGRGEKPVLGIDPSYSTTSTSTRPLAPPHPCPNRSHSGKEARDTVDDDDRTCTAKTPPLCYWIGFMFSCPRNAMQCNALLCSAITALLVETPYPRTHAHHACGNASCSFLPFLPSPVHTILVTTCSPMSCYTSFPVAIVPTNPP